MRSRLFFISLILQMQVFAQFVISDIKVEHIIDGDTFITTIDNEKERVRMKCIDAPELKQTFVGFDGIKKEIGIEAMEYLELMISKGELLQIKCSDGRDKYRRLTCEVFDDNGGSINLQMVKSGYAYVLPSKCFSQADGVIYFGYQHLAKFSQVGLWRHGAWDEPWRWRNNQNISY